VDSLSAPTQVYYSTVHSSSMSAPFRIQWDFASTVNIRLYTLQLYIRMTYNWEISSNEGAREGCKRP